MSKPATISCDMSTGLVLWRYPADAFASASTLLVSDYQKAVIMVNGTVSDVLDTGIYSIGADSLPELYRQLHLPAGFSGMIEAEIWFVNTRHSPIISWEGGVNEELHMDKESMLIAAGDIVFSIKDPRVFFNNIQPSRSSYTSDALFAIIKSDFLHALPGLINQKAKEDEISLENFAPPYDAVAGYIMQQYNAHVAVAHGLRLHQLTLNKLFVTYGLGTKLLEIAQMSPQERSKSATTGWMGCLVILAIVIGSIWGLRSCLH